MIRKLACLPDDLARDLEDASYHTGQSQSKIQTAALRGHIARMTIHMRPTTDASRRLLAKYRPDSEDK